MLGQDSCLEVGSFHEQDSCHGQDSCLSQGSSLEQGCSLCEQALGSSYAPDLRLLVQFCKVLGFDRHFVLDLELGSYFCQVQGFCQHSCLSEEQVMDSCLQMACWSFHEENLHWRPCWVLLILRLAQVLGSQTSFFHGTG